MIHFVLALNRKTNFGTEVVELLLLLDVVVVVDDDIELEEEEEEDWSILTAVEESKGWRLHFLLFLPTRRGVERRDVLHVPFGSCCCS
jgi:hypothetical protein